jgi:hypothetical protein
MTRKRGITIVPFFLLLSVTSLYTAVLAIAQRGFDSRPGPKAGSAACRDCHETIFGRWSDTIHGRMIQAATPTTILGRPGGESRNAGSAFWKDGRFFITDDNGRPRTVDYTLGNRRLQHYLSTEPNGEIHVLARVWDVRRKEWFHSSEIVPGAPKGFVQQWNMTCFFCHVTQQEQDVKGFDPESRKYQTKWVESSASCERCHGPRAMHAAGASDNSAGSRPVKSSFDKLMMCGQCHWPKTTIATGFDTTRNYLDYYVPVFVHTDLNTPANPSGWADGRPRRFSNEARAFFLSGCFQSGQALCVNCHDPHWNRTDGNVELMTRPDQYCESCHSGYAKSDHTHHAQSSAGASCVACHMPKTVEGARDHMRDHSMLGPVPENTVDYGIPNACNECHSDRTPKWAADKVAGWYAKRNPRPRLRALAFSMATRGDTKSVPPLIKLASDKSENAAIRASAVGYLGQFAGPPASAVIPGLAKDPDAFVRIETAKALSRFGSDGADAASAALATLAADQYRSVRIQAAAAIVRLTLSLGRPVLKPDHPAFAAFANALNEYRASLEVENDLPDVMVERGYLELFAGRVPDAIKAYRQALKYDEKLAEAYVGLAYAGLAQNNQEEALKQAKRAFDISGKESHARLVTELQQRSR